MPDSRTVCLAFTASEALVLHVAVSVVFPSIFMTNEFIAYIEKQHVDRQAFLREIHRIILENDKTISPVIEPMMGKEMIIYKDRGMMKYALSSVKNYISLHVLPIYGSKPLHEKYIAMLPEANFQKGCINFETREQLPLEIVQQLIADCAPIDLVKIREDYLKAKKQKK